MKIMKNELADNSAEETGKSFNGVNESFMNFSFLSPPNKLFPNDDLGSIVLKIIACTREVLWKIAGRETRKALAC